MAQTTYQLRRLVTDKHLPYTDKVMQVVELTEAELDAIFEAMGDYQDYGDEETMLADSIRDKLFELGKDLA